MQNDIIQKLKAHVAKPVESECAAVYLLAEIRKVLEARGVDSPALWLYCHWALHVDLTHAHRTKHFLKRIDDYVRMTVAGLKNSRKHDFLEEHGILREFLYLDSLREELKRFLTAHDIETSLCDDNGRWIPFLNALGGVIEDGSLAASAGVNRLKDDEKLSEVVRVEFSKGAAPRNSDFPFTAKWDVSLQDGRTLTIEAQRDPMFAFSVTLRD